jgi:hypothetical protein
MPTGGQSIAKENRMADRIIGDRGSRRRRRLWILVVPALLASAVALFLAGGALAVHDLSFQLDGDTAASTTTTIGSKTQNVDWDTLFSSSGSALPLPPDFTASGFEPDFSHTGSTFQTSDTTTYSTGSKDTLPITPGWQCAFSNNVNSKIDVMNAYAAAYTNPVADANGKHHEIVYFALERNTNTGDANVAFWFLQDRVGCSTTGSSAAFSGNHVDGDLLIVSAFTNGGSVSTIDAYRWQGGANGALNPTPVAHGVDCRASTTSAGDTACAAANTAGITTPWLTSNFKDGVGHALRTAEFFEGGVDLTASGLGDRCFNTFIGDTRSSQSLTATLFDYASGTLGGCSLSMTTTPSQSTRVINSTTPITDSADVVGATAGGGTPPTPTGSVTFFLCSPSQLTPADTGTCAGTSGTQVGSAVTTSQKVPGTATATSADAKGLITGIGRYCFRAHFVAAANDLNYAGQTADEGNAGDECFTVTGVANLSTAQNWLPNDTATLTGDSNLNGSLSFTLYNDATCGNNGGVAVYGPETQTVTNAASGSTFPTHNTSFSVDSSKAGGYSWLVHYDDTTLQDPTDRCETSTLSINDNP